MRYFAYSQKEFVYKYVVMLSDTDQFKHMSFANYLKLMFLATDALFVGCFDGEFLKDNRLKLINSKMQFKRQTTIGDNVLVKINSSGMNDDKFRLLYTFIIENSGELVGLGRQDFRIEKLSGRAPVEDREINKIKGLLSPILVDEGNLLYKY